MFDQDVTISLAQGLGFGNTEERGAGKNMGTKYGDRQIMTPTDYDTRAGPGARRNCVAEAVRFLVLRLGLWRT